MTPIRRRKNIRGQAYQYPGIHDGICLADVHQRLCRMPPFWRVDGKGKAGRSKRTSKYQNISLCVCQLIEAGGGGGVLNFFETSRRYSRMNINCSAVSTTPAKNLSPVSLTPLKNCSPVSTTPPINYSAVSTTPAIEESCLY
jgi:hypothetical protein